MTMQYVPYITTPAGACLTQANWQALGIHYALCGLEQILIKPGLAFWEQSTDLKTYLAWEGAVILDAREFSLNSRDTYVVQSPYDGSRVTLTPTQFETVIRQLNPDMVLKQQPLPAQSNAQLPKKITDIGYEEADGIFLQEGAHRLYASDRPARDALQGVVYNRDGALSLQDSNFALNFELIDADCACPTCQQAFTRAYLHHLLQSTPILCQRFLMMHNVFWMKTHLGDCH